MKKDATIFDVECYRNYFLIAFKNIVTGEVCSFSRYDDGEYVYDFSEKKLRNLISRSRLVGFNSNTYDLPIIYYALHGATNKKLMEATFDIIENNLKPWDFERKYGVRVPKLDHIDLIEVAPGRASLKIYGGRLHCERMRDLPYKPGIRLTKAQMKEVATYCVNDLATTEALYNHLTPQLQLRERMSATYDIDLMSKSDAQIAEAVISRQIADLQGDWPEKPGARPGETHRYRVPSYVRFRDSEMRAILKAVRRSEFVVSDAGKIAMPEALKKAEIRIGRGVYRMGIGGLHSSETCQAVTADDRHMLIDRDVASYYPAIILNQGLYPKHIGKQFLQVYRQIVETRLRAKRDGDKVTADSLKITINGSFGKFGNQYSRLYSPNLLIQTTITGQLSLLLLIEMLEEEGISVVSANTDGIVIYARRSKQKLIDEIVSEWEEETNFETEATEYLALYSRDVNNYIAIKTDGSHKGKGAFAPVNLMKNPSNIIATDAAIERLKTGRPVQETIRECRDIRKFVTVRTVAGGALDSEDNYLGKAIRWYMARGQRGKPLRYAKNGNRVPRSEGAQPLMTLTDAFPKDVDYRWYISEAASILKAVGFNDGCGYEAEDML